MEDEILQAIYLKDLEEVYIKRTGQNMLVVTSEFERLILEIPFEEWKKQFIELNKQINNYEKIK